MIDGWTAGNYNETMESIGENERVDRYIDMDRSEPIKRIVRNDGALYVVLLLVVVCMILISNAVSTRWNWPRAVVQLSLYALLMIIGYLVYRFRLLAFRYVLTERMLSIDRIVGKKVKNDAQTHLKDIESIRPFSKENAAGKRKHLYAGSSRERLVLAVNESGTRRTLIISPSEEFKGKLIAQWKNLRR